MEACEGCCMGKMAQENFTRNPTQKVKSTDILELVHTDVIGPMSVRTPGGNRYAVVFTDDFSRYTSVYFMKKKSEVFSKLVEFKNLVENQTGKRLKRLRSDGGGEYESNQLKRFLKSNGIKHEKSIPYTPQQNGLAERMNRTLVERARCMLHHMKVNKRWWAEAINTSAWLTNRMPNSVNKLTPYEMWYGKKPNLQKLFTFGSTGYCHTPSEKRTKLEAKAMPCIFMGYADDYKGYRVCVRGSNKVIITRTMKLTETAVSSFAGPNQFQMLNDDDDDDEKSPHVGFVTPPTKNMEFVRRRSDSTESDRRVTRSMTREKRLKTEEQDFIGPIPGPEYELCAEEVVREEVAFHVSVNDILPKSFHEAVIGPEKEKWIEAIKSELNSLKKNETWSLCKLPVDKNEVGNKWVFAIKRDENGKVLRYKARLVAQGFSQQPGVDYEHTYSPVACIASVRSFLVAAGEHGLYVEHDDVDTAFLYGELDEEIYMRVPEGFELLADNESSATDGLSLKLGKSLYGLKQASRMWNQKIDQVLTEMGFEATDAEPCIYIRDDHQGLCMICLYVDDLLIAGKDEATVGLIVSALREHFSMKSLGPVKHMLGIEIHYKLADKNLTLQQTKYIEDLVVKFNQQNAKEVSTPMETSLQLTKDNEANDEDEQRLMKTRPYRSLVGALNYLSGTTRPDISVAVTKLSRFLNNPGPKHWDAAIRVVRYLKKTKNYQLSYNFNDGEKGKLVAFSDADWGTDKDDRRSVSGIFITYCGGPLVWKSNYQRTVALSTTEAEYMALSLCVRECVWLRLLLKNLRLEQVGATMINEDNQGAIALAHNVGYQSRTKHIDIQYHFLREKILDKTIDLQYVETRDQLADFMTKPLAAKRLEYLLKKAGFACSEWEC